MSGSDAAHLARVRDNQRRSRARRKEYLQEVEGRLRECEQTGVAASAEIQAAARKVAEENDRLRSLLVRHGVGREEIMGIFDEESYMAQDDEVWAAAESVKSDRAKILGGLLALGKRSCGRPGECTGSAGRHPSASFVQEGIPGPNLAKLESTPEVWSGSPTEAQYTSQSSTNTPHGGHTPDPSASSMPQITSAVNGLARLATERSMEANYSQPKPQIYQSAATPLSTGINMSLAQSSQMPTSMITHPDQLIYQFRPQPQYIAPPPPYHCQPMPQQLEAVAFEQPAFAEGHFSLTPRHPDTYAPTIGTNSCLYMTDVITSMAPDAHPGDVRTNLGCSPQCATDCEVDNPTAFTVMDRYTGLQQT